MSIGQGRSSDAAYTGAFGLWGAAVEYMIDATQRSVLFWDVMRQRGNQYRQHLAETAPHVLDYGAELVVDGRKLERPVNYALVRIVPPAGVEIDLTRRPFVVVDPRAGHGPGIGGFKRDSEVGIALHKGYPVYFVIFFPEPCPGQTLADVLHALRRFVEDLSKRHDGCPPILYGNCQAGWAIALLAADCEGLVGPAVLNGSPLSYWAGESGVNPARIAGGLLGGAWLAHLAADLGNGRFDGAWLVQNFENLKPESVWEKYANLFSHRRPRREHCEQSGRGVRRQSVQSVGSRGFRRSSRLH